MTKSEEEAWDGSVESVEKAVSQWATGEFGVEFFFRDAIWRIVPGLVWQARQSSAPQKAYSNTREAVEIIGELGSALYSEDDIPKRLWQHRKFPERKL